jgi:endo-1,4-beta-D-glucanase Y
MGFLVVIQVFGDTSEAMGQATCLFLLAGIRNNKKAFFDIFKFTRKQLRVENGE